MNFRQNILCLIGISLLVSVAIGGIGGYFMLRNVGNAAYQLENTTKPVLFLEKVRTNFWQAHSLVLQMALDKELHLIYANHAKAVELFSQNDELLRRYAETDFSGPEERALYANLIQNHKRFHALNAKALELDLETTNDEAIALFNKYNNETLIPALNGFMGALDGLTSHVLAVADEANSQNMAHSEAALMAMIGIVGAAVIVLLVTGYYFSSGIMRVVNRVTGIASSFARGNFDDNLEPALLVRKDEFGVMSKALNMMRASLVRLIDDLNTSNEAARKANEYKSVFLARMSHEIRTPLNAIIGMTFIAKKTKEIEIINDSLDKISTSSAHLLGIINDILDMSKIEAGKFELTEEEFGLEKLMMNVCTVASVKADEKELNLQVSLESGLPARFIGDGLRLSQVLTNILGNACKFTPVKGTIRLTVSCPEKHSLHSLVRFTVEDTGIGMTEEQIGRLFSPFEQADSGTSRQFGGTGLGLAICDRIVNLMGGDIRVESEFGKGSRFIITVKLKNSEQFTPSGLDESIDVGRTKIMVIDESEEARSFFINLFGELNVAVTTAGSVAEASGLLRENRDGPPFTILFLDWNTVADEGADFIKEMKAEFGEQVIIVLVYAGKFAEIEDSATEAGINRFLPKPIFPSTVINLVNEVIGTPEAAEFRSLPTDASFIGKRVLLVEDNEMNREIALAYLEDTGITIDVAVNGVEAVEKYLAANGKYDLVLMDVHMPVMDGLTASRRIRAEETARGMRAGSIVAMTANAFKEDIEHCLDAGMNDHLAKPLNIDAVMRILQKYL